MTAPLGPGYRRLLQTIASHLCREPGSQVSLHELARLLEEHRIGSLLEVGAGAGRFLTSLAPLLNGVHVELFAVDRSFDAYARHLLERAGVSTAEIDATDLAERFRSRTFDLIVAVGVLSMATIETARGPRHPGRNRVLDVARSHARIVHCCVARLSGHPDASLYLVSPTSFLLLRPGDVASAGRVVHWELEPRKRAAGWFRDISARYAAAFSLSTRERVSHAEIWRSAADHAVIAGPASRSSISGNRS